MTPKKRLAWARFFFSARRHGVGGLKLIRFSVACARDLGSVEPFLLAVRVVRRTAAQGQGWDEGPTWHLPRTWAPRALGVVALGVVVWGLTLGDGRTLTARRGGEVREIETPGWVFSDRSDREWVAKKLPGTRLNGQMEPPCGKAPAQVIINDGCWVKLAAPPPCGDLYEHEGSCYIPVAEKKRPPTSVDE